MDLVTHYEEVISELKDDIAALRKRCRHQRDELTRFNRNWNMLPEDERVHVTELMAKLKEQENIIGRFEQMQELYIKQSRELDEERRACRQAYKERNELREKLEGMGYNG